MMQEDEEPEEAVVAEEKWEAAGGAGSALGEVRVVAEGPGTWMGRAWRWLKSSGPDLKVGTLQYTGLGLLVMCLWLFWGDMVFSLSEAAPSTIALQLDRLGIPKQWMGFLMGTFGATINFFMVPVISFRSDRTRTRWGRRVPYIMWTVIPLSITLAALGFTDDIGAWIRASDWPARVGLSPMTMIILVVGTMIVVFDVTNVFINTVWWYLLRDVVPTKYMTRFMAVFALIGTMMGMVWNRFFYPHIETATKEIYLGAAVLYLVGFSVMCLMVKEGKYPPPEAVDMRQAWAERLWKAVKTYFTQSFAHPLILMFYTGTAVAAFTGAAAFVTTLYFLRYLHFTTLLLGLYGFYQGSAILLIKLPIGWLIDKRIHPMKAIFYSQMLLLPVPFLFFFLGNYTVAGVAFSAYAMWVAINMYQCPIVQFNALSGFPLITMIFPGEQFGQFSSANAMVGSLIRIVASVLGALFIGWTTWKFGEYGDSFCFMWSGTFALIGFTSTCVLFRYWHLFGGPNFKLDLKVGTKGSGVSSAQLWRPIKIGAAATALIVAAGIFGLVVLAHRPNMGFTVDFDKELTSAKTLSQLAQRVEGERSGFEERHRDNLKILAKKHLFFGRDRVTELGNYEESLKDLERMGRVAQVNVAVQALAKAKIRWCVVDEGAVDYWLARPVKVLDVKVVMDAESAEGAGKALEAAEFQVKRTEGAINLQGHFGVRIPMSTDGGYREILERAEKAKVEGLAWRMEKLEDTMQWKISAWRDAARAAGDREKDWADICALTKLHKELRANLPEDVREKLK